MDRGIKQSFLQRRYANTKQVQEEILNIKEVHIRITMRSHFTTVKIAIIKKQKITKFGQCCEDDKSFMHDGNAN